MKYGFVQKLMWAGYKGTFKKQLSEALRESDPKAVMKEAHKKYKKILADVTEFEKGDRFLINILSCALLSSILKSQYRVSPSGSSQTTQICPERLT